MNDRRVVHRQEFQGLGIEEPHRNRIALEKQSERLLLGYQAADIGQRHGEEIAHLHDAYPKVLLIVQGALEFEVGAAAAVENRDEARQHLARLNLVADFGEMPSAEVFGSSLHDQGGDLV